MDSTARGAERLPHCLPGRRPCVHASAPLSQAEPTWDLGFHICSLFSVGCLTPISAHMAKTSTALVALPAERILLPQQSGLKEEAEAEVGRGASTCPSCRFRAVLTPQSVISPCTRYQGLHPQGLFPVCFPLLQTRRFLPALPHSPVTNHSSASICPTFADVLCLLCSSTTF